ncbi:MAG: hypothetical protein J6Y37_13765 [Paludibacteraceae bacterium]|nr:hypothetical protein [Paludibacteraceae bacterium]
MAAGRTNLTSHIIRVICDVCSWHEEDVYTRSQRYGDRDYWYSTYDKEWVDSARMSVAYKTLRWKSEMARMSRFADTLGITPAPLDYVDRNF